MRYFRYSTQNRNNENITMHKPSLDLSMSPLLSSSPSIGEPKRYFISLATMSRGIYQIHILWILETVTFWTYEDDMQKDFTIFTIQGPRIYKLFTKRVREKNGKGGRGGGGGSDIRVSFALHFRTGSIITNYYQLLPIITNYYQSTLNP